MRKSISAPTLAAVLWLMCAPSCGDGGRQGPTGTGGSAGGTGGSPGATGGAGGTRTDGCLDFGPAELVGTIEATGLNQLSGLVASRAHPGVLYAHADTAGKPRLVALDTTGKVLVDFTVADAGAIDWEDIAIGNDPSGAGVIFIGDIGDNAARDGSGTPRTEIQVHRVPEPAVSPGQAAVKQTLTGASTWRFTYPDGPHDAETLMVDPVAGDLVIVTRELDGNSTVFRAPPLTGTPPATPIVLESVAQVQFGVPDTASARVSAGDLSPTGDRIIIRTQTAILIWPRLPGSDLKLSLAASFAQAPRYLSQPRQPQAEAITFSADGGAWFSAGEGEPAIYQGIASCP